MTVTEAVRDRLLSLSAVTDIVGQRVYNLMFPQNFTRPAIRVERVTDIPGAHLRGMGLWDARVQVYCVAASKAQVDAIDAAVFGDGAGSGLAFWKGGIGSPPFQVDLCQPDLSGDDAERLSGGAIDFIDRRDYLVKHR